MLTRLQLRVCRIVAELPEAESVALAGGGALIVHGIVDRSTTDLDYFSPDVVDVRVLAEAVRSALTKEGMRVAAPRSSSDFVRLEVSDSTDDLTIDFGISQRHFSPVFTTRGRVLAPEDLAGDKMLALFGRAEPRDYIDAYALAMRFELSELYQLAADKDPGFSLEHLRDALGVFDHHPRQAFPLTDEDYERLRHWVRQWCDDLADAAERSRGGQDGET